jgi:hypothetical protein
VKITLAPTTPTGGKEIWAFALKENMGNHGARECRMVTVHVWSMKSGDKSLTCNTLNYEFDDHWKMVIEKVAKGEYGKGTFRADQFSILET